jgi:hypothetical protein
MLHKAFHCVKMFFSGGVGSFLHPLPTSTIALAPPPLFMNSPLLLHHFEHCNRDGFWSRDWEKQQPDDVEMLNRAIKSGMTTTRQDFGQAAGEECFEMGSTCGLQTSKYSVHDQVVHLSFLSDLICTAVRKAAEPPWLLPEPVDLGKGPLWHSGAFLAPSGNFLRRVALVSSWNDDRHFSECRAWSSLGEVCAYSLPMQLVVAVIGQNKGGKRHSYWTRGLRHPANKTLRFRKKNDLGTPFKSTYLETWREDHDEITTKEWLEGMLQDGVLTDVLLKVDIPVPTAEARQRIVDLATRRLEEIQNLDKLPEQQLSTCDWPKVCAHRNHCHAGEEPSGRYGFVRVDSL